MTRRPAARLPAAALLAAVLLLAGCATVRRAREAQDAARAPAGERTVTAAEAGLTTNTVLTIDDAVRIALAYQPSVARARYALAAATAQVRQAVAAYGPAVSASAGHRQGTANTAGAPERFTLGRSTSAAADVHWLLYDFGKTPALVRQAVQNEVDAEASLRSTRVAVAFDVRTRFFTYAQALELLEVQADAVRQYEAHLDQVRAYRAVGTRTRYDVTKAEVDVGNARLALIDARNAVITGAASLNRGMGLAEAPRCRLTPPPDTDVPGDAATLMAEARARHPALQALHAREQVASAGVDAAIADLYPSLGLSGEYGVGGAHFPLVWNVFGALQGTIDLFTSGRKTAAIDAAVAALRAARSDVADREQQLYLDLDNALSQREHARQRQALTDLICREAQESLDLVRERYRLGKAAAVEVTDAEVALTSAKADRVKAHYEAQAAVAQIRNVIGAEGS